MPELSLIQQICIWALPVLLAITLHEAAHAYVACRCGDSTAKMLGRLSINPMRHIDPLGTVIIPLLVGVLTKFSFIIGFAKPVPINWNQLKNPRRDGFLVAIAGPVANFLMVILWASCFKLVTLLHLKLSMPVLFILLTARAGILINLILGFLNLIPIPPLDGGRVVSSLLPPRFADAYSRVELYGFFILLLLLFTGVLGLILGPLIQSSFNLVVRLFGL